MFYILSILCYARARLTQRPTYKWLLAAACLLSAIVALGTKETTVTLPFFLLLYEWFFFQNLSRGVEHRRHRLAAFGQTKLTSGFAGIDVSAIVAACH